MRFSDTAKNRMLDRMDEASPGGAGVGATHASLHTAYSSSGANELTGGSPAYARVAATWNAAGAAVQGQKALAAALAAFNVPAGQTVRWVGFWDASTSGTFLGMTPNGGTTPEGFVVPDATADVLECPGNSFATNDQVVVWDTAGDDLPAGLVEGTVYFVINRTADDLQLSATLGGASVSITAVGTGFLQKIVPEAFGAQGTHTVTAATLALD